jgi:hypothetical protein
MNCSVSAAADTGYKQYPLASATYIGTNIARFWHDPFLRKALVDAIKAAGEDKDIFDYCNFLFSQVDNAVRRRYGGRELQLESIKVVGEHDQITVVSFQ